MKNRTVLDTNIWLDFIFSNKMRELTDLMDNNKVVFLRSVSSNNELEKVLAYDKLKKYKLNTKKIIQLYTAITEYIETQEIFKECSDPKDNFLFDLSYIGQCQLLSFKR